MKKEVNYNMLPKDKNGGISWKNSIGYKVPFFYDEVEGEIEIVGYNNGKLTVKYLNKEPEDFIDYIIWRIESHPNVLSSDELNVIEGYFMNSQARKQNGAIFFPANGPSLID